VRWGLPQQAAMRATLAGLRLGRPAIPRRFRWILPAQLAHRRALREARE
jgi:hypothetical protein